MGETAELDRTTAGDEILPGLARPASRHGRLTVLSMMKDEAPYLIEWIAHHLAVGFTDFVVYTNDCTDGTDAMLRRLQELGLAQHRDNVIPEGMKPQPSALRHAQREAAVVQSDWLLPIDADEFLCLGHGDGHLDTLLDAMDHAGANGLVLTWRIYGSGGITRWSPDPVTEQYRMAAPKMWKKGWGVKTLFRFQPEYWKLGIHRPKIKKRIQETPFPDSVHWLNGSGQPVEDYFKFHGWRSTKTSVGYEWAQLNHYAIKSVESYALRRLRGNVNNKADKYNAEYWALQDRNEVEDDIAMRHGDARRRIAGILLSDPVLRRLHDDAVAATEARLAALRETPEYAALAAELREASAVPIARASARPPKARDPERIARLLSDVERRRGAPVVARGTRVVASEETDPQDLIQFRPEGDAEGSVEWFQNHSVHLPSDPRLFTREGLIQIQEGKFQRNPARNLPRIVGGAGTCLEIGAAGGFIGLHLAGVQPGLEVVLLERDAGWRAELARVMARNGMAEGARLRTGDGADLMAAAEAAAPQTLILGDPEIDAATLSGLFDVMTPARVIVLGRLLVQSFASGTLPDFARICGDQGLTETLPLDPTAVIGFMRP